MAQNRQLRETLLSALAQCGGNLETRQTGHMLVGETFRGDWDIPKFFDKIAAVLGPVNQPIELIDGTTQERITFQFKDAVAILCMRIMISGELGFGVPNQNMLRPYAEIFRPGIWGWVVKPIVYVTYVPPEDLAQEDLPIPAPIPAPIPEDAPEIKIPAGQEDVISMAPIPDGTRMVDFHGERAKHRYYTEATYNALNPKKNPYTRQAIEPNQVTRYIAKLDSTLPVQQAGRRRKTRKTKRRARKTRRRHK